MAIHIASHGRGGAGNMASTPDRSSLTPVDLQTPTLKTPIVTTGRGGTGNMARNDDPHETRMRQDVEGVLRRSSSGTQHSGRGGAGNIFSESDAEAARKAIAIDGTAVDEPPQSGSPDSTEGFAAWGKQWLSQLGRK